MEEKNFCSRSIDLPIFRTKNWKMSVSSLRVHRSHVALLFLGLSLLVAAPAHGGRRLPKCCVWRVTNAKAPCYLVGSIHALSRNDYPLPAPYEIALRESRRIVFEFDPRRYAEFEKKFEAAAKYPPGQDIRSRIHPELLAWLRRNMVTIKSDAGLRRQGQVENFESQLCYRPWWIAQHLVVPATYSETSAARGLDNYFVERARRGGKEIGGLESVDEHVAVMSGLSDRESEFMLWDALTRPKEGAKEFNRMHKAWRRGDTNALWAGDGRMRKEAPRLAARLVAQRNVKWIPRIETELRSGKPTAIVAGALHFAGPRSVIALLQKRGYQIEQL
jgi:uncharacterized protein YbaP (TraB family)